ncbi:MAG TPA: UDP-N-acetylmuramate--L-alanine ligase, partial [Candidatus Goldiibacteriota bacterium]|nr:UDP-N-acetylmuramate--L-alanine ligase [Candidatus Goldiibacteriota bacterium]
SDTTQRIKSMGGKVFIGHDKKNVKGAQVLVYSNAVPETNPEITQARSMKIPVIPRAVMLNEVMRLKKGIAIAGSHGKTTTTSMLAEIFETAGLDPTFVVGGLVKSKGAHAKAGKGEYVIAEACEAFGSFLHLNPVICGVTNIDNDHMDYYKRMDALKQAFVQFINKTPFFGAAYLNGDDKNVRDIEGEIYVKKLFYGMGRENDIVVSNIRAKGFSQTFEMSFEGKKLGTFKLNVPGSHNVMNAALCASIAYGQGIKPAVIKKALASFQNVQRRFNVFKNKMFTVVDDYAHHPAEIAKTLETARTVAGKKKVIAVFQPHLFSRTQYHYPDFAKSLSAADAVILDNIYPSREAPVPGVTSQLISDAMTESGYKNVYYEKNWEAVTNRVMSIVKKGDYVMLMGAGNVNQIRKLLEREAE